MGERSKSLKSERMAATPDSTECARVEVRTRHRKGNERKPMSVAEFMDKWFGRIVVVSVIVGYLVATLGRMVLELLGGIAIFVAVWLFRKWRWRLDRKNRASQLVGIKGRFAGLRMKKAKSGKKSKLKPYSPMRMPLGLAKLVRTGDPGASS